MRRLREILRLTFEAGLSQKAIAVSANVAQSTVSDYVSRARRAGLGWPPGPELDDEAALERLLFPTAPVSPAPARGHGPRAQPALPRIEVTHTLDAPDQICQARGGNLVPWDGQYEEAEEIDVVERSFRVVRHKRQKYRCRCGACIDTALGPPKLIAGGRYSVDFAVAVAVGKYLDHLPLARQVRQMARAGLRVDTQTLWDQLAALNHHLEPTYAALVDDVLAAPVVGADETTWQLMEPGRSKTWYVWALTRPDAVVYRLRGSRSAATAAEVLGPYQGVVMCDGYAAYRALAKGEAAQALAVGSLTR